MNGDLLYLSRRAKRLIGKKVQYALRRNVLPRNVSERLLLKGGPRVMANSIPKAGTNLLNQLLKEMPNTVERWTYHIDETLPGVERQIVSGHRGQVITAHLPWSEEMSRLLKDMDYRIFLMVRDPRDIAVSNVNYVTRMDLSHPLHPYLKSLPNDDERLTAMINPPVEILDGLPDIWKNDGLTTFLPWLNEKNCLMIRFEDLVGEKGGGSIDRQCETITSIAKHIGALLSNDELVDMANGLFGSEGSKTFHKGQIGGWRAHFSQANKDAFKKKSGETLIRLGYENTLDW